MLFRRRMSEDEVHQPHDKLFRAAFSNPETAAAFLQAYLDPALVAPVDRDIKPKVIWAWSGEPLFERRHEEIQGVMWKRWGCGQ